MDNFIELKLKIKGGGRWPFALFSKKKVGFLFTQYAWFFAFDEMDVGLTDFDKLDQETQLVAVATGAANYCNMMNGEKHRYSREQIRAALMKATIEENKKLGEAMSNASFPEWLQTIVGKEQKPDPQDEIAKKKSTKRTSSK